jgi:hypothetical protein
MNHTKDRRRTGSKGGRLKERRGIFYTTNYSTVQYSTGTVQVQYSTVQYSTLQYSTVQYSTVPGTVQCTVRTCTGTVRVVYVPVL